MHTPDIRIGILVDGDNQSAEYIRQLMPHGFESFNLTFWQNIGQTNLAKAADDVQAVLDGTGKVISAVSMFGNPLADDEAAAEARRSWAALIEHASRFGCDIVSGFAGRLVDQPIHDSVGRFAEVFTPLAERAGELGLRLAFENCDMGGTWQHGDWNMAQTPDAWELMFTAVPLDNIGLEWEPCHQMVKLIDPMPQLRAWVHKIFHMHGKDATVLWDVVRAHGVYGPKQFAFHRTPGFGDSNWTDIISELRRGGFTGSIDIEGWHDPVYCGELEMTGQVHGLHYLKHCRGGEFVPNPVFMTA